MTSVVNGPTVTLFETALGGAFSDGDWVESKDQDPAGEIRLTQLADVGVGVFRNRSDRWLREDQAKRLRCTFLEPDDVLIARMPDPIGRACLAPKGLGRAVSVVDVALLRIRRPDVDPRYVMWMINSPQFHTAVEALQSGTTRKRISRRRLSGLRLPLPPLAEQRRLVEILEDHLSRLDAADAYLDASLKRSSSLTEAWLHPRLQGHTGQPLVQLLRQPLSNGRSVPTADTGFPVLRLTALKEGVVDLGEWKTGAWTAEDARPFLVAEGDFLVSRGNGSLQRVALGGIVPKVHEPVAYPDTMIRIRGDVEQIDTSFLAATWNSRVVRRQIEAAARTTAGIYKVNQKQLEGMLIPLPCVREQAEIAKQVGQLQQSIAAQRPCLEQARSRGTALRRSLLSAAFLGRLTQTTSSDEIQEMAGV